MKTALSAFLAAVFGGFVGAWAWSHLERLQSPTPELRTRNLVLVDDSGKPAARLGFTDRRTVLQFYGRDSKPEIELGIEPTSDAMFLGFAGRAALNALPNGDTTLAMGDNRFGPSRLLLGAIEDTDTPTPPEANVWGLAIGRPGAPGSTLRAVERGVPTSGIPSAALTVRRQDGTLWSIR